MKNKTIWVSLAVLILVGATAITFYGKQKTPSEQDGKGGKNGTNRPAPVVAIPARTGYMDIIINGLGTVTARNTVTVKPRVDGLLMRIAFHEGQLVKAGEVLAELDSRTFKAQLDQTNGQLLRDQALLANARLDLARYKGLLAKDSIAEQQVDAQKSLVHQYEGQVLTDRAQWDNAKLQLEFTRITAPVAGRLGLRQVDVGNMVHASDTGGLVVITQTQPITVVFTIPSDNLPAVISKLQANETLKVETWDREGKTKLAMGKLLTFDNQIDPTTGTVKLKAEFPNTDNALFPNQFVNARLRVETRHGLTLVPVAAIQRGTQGTFLYVVKDENTVSLRPVTLGPTMDDIVAVDKGLAPGEQVVIDGVDKLRDGAKVKVSSPESRKADLKKSPEKGGRNKHHKVNSESKDGA